MESRKFWNVLIVDDEPDIHEVTSLALKRETIFGAKLKLHHANSAAEARAFFETNDAANSLAVALIDVVMETDDAGLKLCQWIREERGNHAAQLILRTGQPGKAPPREVIDSFNISWYLAKIEATPDRLYMALKSAIQNYYNLQYLFWSADLFDAARRSCETPQDLFDTFKALSSEPPTPGLGLEFHRAIDFFGRHYLGQGFFAKKENYDAIRSRLLEEGGEALRTTGVATIGNDAVVTTRILGTDKHVVMVVRDAVYPRGLIQLYGSVWRQNLAFLGEVFQRLP
jgi:CheY-like chemotaxis protein